MHSGFEIPGIQQNDNTSTPIMLSMNRANHILDQIHVLPTTQQLLLEQHHHLLPSPHHYSDASYFPGVNFKLGLNEICSRNEHLKDRGPGGENLQFDVQKIKNSHSSLGILHCWNDHHDSSLKQQPFWEPLPIEASNENSEIVDRQEHMELNQKQIHTSIDGKLHFGELEAIYNRCENKTNDPSPQNHHHLLNNDQIPSEFDHGVEESTKKRRKKRKGDSFYSSEVFYPMAEFFGNFVKQMMDHQESLHRKFTEMIERLDEERRVREGYWRNQEMVHLQHEKMAHAKERRLAQSREAMIVSYLEKITGQKVNFSGEITSASNGDEEKLGKNG